MIYFAKSLKYLKDSQVLQNSSFNHSDCFNLNRDFLLLKYLLILLIVQQ